MRHTFTSPTTEVRASLREGDDVAIELEELGAAGYVWEALDAASTIACTKESVVGPPSPEGMVGGPTKIRFVITASAPGTTTTTLVHRRPWESADDAERIAVTIVRS